MGMSNYEPFGPEWENELMKHSKVSLIQMYKSVCVNNKKLMDAQTPKGASLGYSKRYVSVITGEMIEEERIMNNNDPSLTEEERQKCKDSPYYYYTHYYMVNGKPATTTLTEEEFNSNFNKP